jgi:hypothetical protein
MLNFVAGGVDCVPVRPGGKPTRAPHPAGGGRAGGRGQAGLCQPRPRTQGECPCDWWRPTQLVEGGLEAEARQVFANLGHVLKVSVPVTGGGPPSGGGRAGGRGQAGLCQPRPCTQGECPCDWWVPSLSTPPTWWREDWRPRPGRSLPTSATYSR